MIVIIVTCLLICLCVCGIQDLKSRKISNIWIVIGVISGVWLRGIYFISAAVVILVFSYWLYYFRMMGAADLKVMALICGYLGIGPGVNAIVLGIILSAAGSLLYLGCCGKLNVILARLFHLMVWFRHVIQTKERITYDRAGGAGERFVVPLGSYLCAGTMLYLFLSSWKGGL